MGGYWGPELKHAGYDTVIISGKSPTPVYLWINDDKVEIRDATHLWGKDIRETQKMIREELKNEQSSNLYVLVQLVKIKFMVASIEHSTGASFSRAGVGAVMGDKKLKAIAVYGTKDLNVAKPSQFIELCEKILRKVSQT